MALKYAGMLGVIVAGMLGLNLVSDHGVPFDVDAVTCVYFRYSFDEGTQVVVRDAQQIALIMDALRLKPAEKSCCDFVESVQFTVAGENHVAMVNSSQFDLSGRHRAHFVMPKPFYAIMQAYRDSSRLREPWDGHYGDALK